jgi:hypothetical protein
MCDRAHDAGEACSTTVIGTRARASQAHARPTASFARADDAPARCWLWDNHYALTLGGEPARYMDGGPLQEAECRTHRNFTGAICAHHPDKEGHVTDQYAVQGQDGTPYLCYFDKPHNLAFVWDGTRGEQVGVHFDGHSEPESDWFVWDRISAAYSGPPVGILEDFQLACKGYIERTYGTPAIVSAFRAGLEGTSRGERGHLLFMDGGPLDLAYIAGQEIRIKVEDLS